jgi:glycosyltransferase involved in cell wall biosynthesis
MQEFLKRLAPNVIHSHDVYGIMVQGMAVPRVFTVHGFIHGDALLQKRLPRLRSWLWKRVETAGWADQPHIVSISPYVRERLTGIAQGVIHDIDNPISDRFFGVERAEQPQRVFSAAHISRRKNPVSLIRAFGRLSQMGVKAELRLAGAPSNDGYLAEVKAAISEMHLESSVRLLGKLDYQAVLDELKLATVFALVSLEENSPMGIEEAMAVGVPVVTSNRCGMPYMVRDGETGFLVNPNDPDDIASRLRDVLTASPSRRKEMSDKSRQVALDRFHPRRIAERTREVYLRAIHDFRNHGR